MGSSRSLEDYRRSFGTTQTVGRNGSEFLKNAANILIFNENLIQG